MIRTTVFLVIASAMSVAQADAPVHAAPTELGVIYHPNVKGPQLTRSQVAADLAAAQQKPDWEQLSKTGERPRASVGAKSRAQVMEELRSAQAQQGWDFYSRTGYDYPAAHRLDGAMNASRR